MTVILKFLIFFSTVLFHFQPHPANVRPDYGNYYRMWSWKWMGLYLNLLKGGSSEVEGTIQRIVGNNLKLFSKFDFYEYFSGIVHFLCYLITNNGPVNSGLKW